GRIEQGLAEGESSATAAFRDDAGGGAVFNRASGVIPLGLPQNLNTGQVARQAVEPEKRSVADPLQRALAERRHCTFWPAPRRRALLVSKLGVSLCHAKPHCNAEQLHEPDCRDYRNVLQRLKRGI